MFYKKNLLSRIPMMGHGTWWGGDDGWEDTEEVSTKTHYIYLETSIKVCCSHILDLPIVLIIN